jgi:hypothetical protein
MSGNMKPQVFPDCAYCGQPFGPRRRKAHRYCSYACAYAARATGPTVRYESTLTAAATHARVKRAVARGVLHRPSACENCGQERRLEGAHFDYSEPLRVRWLCIPCHRIWDGREPKGGARRVDLAPAGAA